MVSEFLTQLKAIVGDGGLLVDDQIEPRYHGDWSAAAPQAPLAVVRPATTDQLSAILKACHGAGQPVVVQGGLTGLSGGATPAEGELAISLERMSGIEELDRRSMTMTVKAGTPLQVIQEAAQDAGFSFPLDLGARGSCNIGGNIATNAGGTEVIRFGMVRNLVLGLETVLADGTVISSLNKMLKNNAGYDLKHLFIGTEGTLGIITRAVLRLYPRLTSKCTALCASDSFDKVLDLLHQTAASCGGSLSTFEVMWSNYFHFICDRLPGARSPFEERYPLYILIEAEGADAQHNDQLFQDILAEALENGVLSDAVIAQSLQDANAFWGIRDGVGDIPELLNECATFDVSVATGDIQAFVADTEAALERAFDDPTTLVFGHVGDNNLHLCVTTGNRADYEVINDTVYETVSKYRGSVSAEHGIGTLRRKYLPYSRSSEEIELMKLLKRTLDPKGILNQGRIV